jgi:hypothetical protein
MSQHDYIIDNQLAPAFRSDLNSALAAIVSQNSGVTAPTTTYANMLWYDTTNDLLKMRNESNSAFITLGTIDQTNSVFNPNFLPATQAEAEAGTNNVKGVTPLRVAQAIAALASAGTTVNIQAFTSTGTYTPTSGYKWGIAFVTGGGGGGGGTGNTGPSRGGGGAGATAIGLLNLTTLGAVTATVGAGGGGRNTSSTGGSAGGASTLSTLSGGGGALVGSSPTGASGGSASGGIINISGGTGQDGVTGDNGGGGGGSFWGGGVRPSSSASVYGGGGGGADDTSNSYGGNGEAGVIFIMEFK